MTAMTFTPGEVISYLAMCATEGASLQRGMNFRLSSTHSVLLMSRRANAPYADRIEDDGRVLIYEGHDEPRQVSTRDPKGVDQPEFTPGGGPTQNRLFREAAAEYRAGTRQPELVRVYEKIKQGIWVYNGIFRLSDAWQEPSGERQVFKFRLELLDQQLGADAASAERMRMDLDHTRLIPTAVKLEVWKRDRGKCVTCGSSDNLHFDHVLPFSKGGTSLRTENIQLLCARHNLEKHDRIE